MSFQEMLEQCCPAEQDPHYGDEDAEVLNRKTVLAWKFPMHYRIGMVVLFLATASIFITSNNSMGAWVELTVTPYKDGHHIYLSSIVSEAKAMHLDPAVLETMETVRSFQSNAETIGGLFGRQLIEIKLDGGLDNLMDANFKSMAIGTDMVDDGSHVNVDEMLTVAMESELLAATGTGANELGVALDPHFFVTPEQEQGIEALESFVEYYAEQTNLSSAGRSSSAHFHTEPVEYTEKVLTFTLGSSIHDFFESNAFWLAFLIAGFSGAWPYIKIVMLLVCWLAPMTYHRREKVLMFLDQVGKYSYIDAHVTVTMIVAFYFTMKISALNYALEVGIVVQPGVGLTLFLMGTILSQMYSQLLLELDMRYIRPELLAAICKQAQSGSYKQLPLSEETKKRVLDTTRDVDVDMSAMSVPVMVSAATDARAYPRLAPAATMAKKREQLLQRAGVDSDAVEMQRWMLCSLSEFLNASFFRESMYDMIAELKHKAEDSDADDDAQQQYESGTGRLLDGEVGDGAFQKSLTQLSAAASEKKARREDEAMTWLQVPLFQRYLPNSAIGVCIRSFMLVLLIVCTICTLESIAAAPVRYDIGGLVEWFLSYDDTHIINTTWEVWLKMPHRTNHKFDAWFCSIVYVITVCIMPMATCTLCVLVWFLPVNYKLHRFAAKMILPFMSWSAMDVFCVASIAASQELHLVSTWILNTKFPEICGRHGIIKKVTGEQCFSVDGNVVWPCYMMIFSCFSFWFCVYYTVQQYNASMKRREFRLFL